MTERDDAGRRELEESLVEPGTLAPLRREGAALFSPSGQRYVIEDGIVRLLNQVDPELARELDAQDRGVEEYTDPRLLMPRYELDMAELALLGMFGGQPPRGNVLDAGCGIGILGKMFPDLGLTGLDASFTLLRRATVGYRVRVEASAEALPFADKSFDVVVALNMLHHVIRPEAAVREFARVLRPGGTLIALDPRKVMPIELAKRVLRRNNAAFAPTHKAFEVGEYDAIIRQAGLFQLDEMRRVGLLALIVMAGFDALRWSHRVKEPDRLVRALVSADRNLFRIPGIARAGLNLAVRARRATAT